MSNTKTLILPATYPGGLSPPNSSHHHHRRRRIVSALHIGGLVASLISIALFSAAIPKWNANFFHNVGPSSGDWTDGMPLGSLVFAFLYHATVLIHSRVRSLRNPSMQKSSLSRRSILVHITVSVLVLLSLVPALFLAGYGSLFRVWRPAMRTQSGILVCNMLNVFARECEPVLYSIGNLQIGAIVFGSFVWAIHFTLLLDDLRRWRRYMLVKQLQREKLAHYGGHEDRSTTTHSHGKRRGHGVRRHGSSSLGSGEDVAQHGHQQTSNWTRSPKSEPRKGSLNRSAADVSVQGRHDAPIDLALPPPSHPAVPRR